MNINLTKIKENLGNIFIGLTILGVFLFGRKCGSNNSSKSDLQTITDTLIIHKVDTIRDTTTIFKFKSIKPIAKDSIKIVLDSSMFKGLSYKRIYLNEFRDSNIVINSIDTVLGYQTDKTIKYKLLVPLRIYDSTKVVIRKDSLIYKPYKYEIHAGLAASPKFIAPKIELSIDKSTYGLGYDFINKVPMIEYKFRIIGWTPKKRR